MNETKIRDEFTTTLDHIEGISTRLGPLTGKGRPLSFADAHKLSEGLFLTSWTHWEQFLRQLFIEDLACTPDSALRREVKAFRTKNAPKRLAEAMIGHPDARRWVEWSEFNDVISRASSLLGPTNRFTSVSINQNDLGMLKRIRNAIAHKSDVSWDSFCKLVRAVPFSLTANQMKGITVGRFLIAHRWKGHPVLMESLSCLRINAQVLVP
jgi:hypothetical protein